MNVHKKNGNPMRKYILYILSAVLLIAVALFGVYQYVNRIVVQANIASMRELAEHDKQAMGVSLRSRVTSAENLADSLASQSILSIQGLHESLFAANYQLKTKKIYLLGSNGKFYSSNGTAKEDADYARMVSEHPDGFIDRVPSTSKKFDDGILLIGRPVSGLNVEGVSFSYIITETRLQDLNSELIINSYQNRGKSAIIDADGSYIVNEAGRLQENAFEMLHANAQIKGMTVDAYIQKIKTEPETAITLTLEGEPYISLTSAMEQGWLFVTYCPSSVFAEESNRLAALFIGLAVVMAAAVAAVVILILRSRSRKNLEEKYEEIQILNEKLVENQSQLEESVSEQESQLEEITALNHELEEHQAQLEESSAEQESQLTEIQELNDRLKDNLEKVNIFAALSYEYCAVQVADLDAETISTIRQSTGMVRENYEKVTTPYWDTVKSMVECFVLPEIREDFLKFLDPKAMRIRMEQEEVFTYRYAIIPDECGDYVYEMTFVNISEDKNRHLLVLGTRCIDKILQFEREEGQYNTALLNECEFFFSFDVTSGMITEDFISRSNYELLNELEVSFPIAYDDFWQKRIDKQALKAKTEKEAQYWTVAGLKRAFEEGKSTVSLRYDSDTVGRMWEATIILTQDITSKRLHAVYICKDVTEMMKADLETKQALERAKVEAEAANNAKTSFLFNMSHDIRTPMNAIMGFRDLLEKHQEEPEKRADYLKKIEESSNVLLSIINNVLEMARIEKGTIEIDESAWSAEQFNDTLYSIFHEMMKQKGISFTRRVDVKNPYVYCDPIKLREVFINILSNAYKYTRAGGSVTMLLEEIPSDREGYAMYRTTITDTGIGMSEEFLPHVFEEFSREYNTTDNKIEGTGLGMPIVKRLVELMEGTIEVRSKKGVGSTFIVTVPHRIAEKSSLVEHAGVEIDPKLFKDKRILLTEDNDLNAEIALEILGEAGFIVDRAEDGAICCEKLSCAANNFYDLILMDIQMPHMNGYEATRTIRKMADTTKANIPILAMTANAFEEDKREALRSGMNGHLAKPINVTELMKALAGILS